MFNPYTAYWNAYIEILEQQIELTTHMLELCKVPSERNKRERPPYLRLVVNND